MGENTSPWIQGLARTRKVAFGRIATLFGATEITESLWEDLEAILVQADLGMDIVIPLIADLRRQVFEKGITRTSEVFFLLQQSLRALLTPLPGSLLPDIKPRIILLVGVNGSGKTTTAAKLAHYYSKQGSRVLLAAADTFRAAAVDQLKVWGERLNIPVLSGQENADPGAVTYDAIQSAVARQMDILLVDTAGRLHTRYNLMEEIKKVYRVCAKAMPGSPHAVWLVIDATTGQNALTQAKSFEEAVHVDGIILAKLDSSAKGGMAFAIQRQLHLPILFVGLGEKLDDLSVFDPDHFVKSIL